MNQHRIEDAFDLPTTTFGPIEKYVAANDNVPLDESGASAGFFAGLTVEQKGHALAYRGEESFGDLAYASRPGDFMQVYSGRKFWPMDPTPDEIHIEDIAHSLSLQCRYAGHCIRFYSVAEHSVHVAHWLLREYGPQTALHGLLHDASEAYLIDVPRPVKPFLPGYKEAEAKVQAAVGVRFELARDMPAVVKEADDRIIADELSNLRPMDWHAKHDDPLGIKLACWGPDIAEDEFLSTFVMLQRKLGRA